ncbi:MAG: YceI family protein [Ardenticatenaceae bacterium]|nr:YceI family protein [Anaerolineales bacterium]MCB8921692.1 YceI family protein [Ardenticatenaceae bacterium]MCB8990789.1 YceI family protein [Ardenticatenaceae bacterium]MCB9003276.1 YceI family protein [Ardenticatenaceae bacterium]
MYTAINLNGRSPPNAPLAWQRDARLLSERRPSHAQETPVFLLVTRKLANLQLRGKIPFMNQDKLLRNSVIFMVVGISFIAALYMMTQGGSEIVSEPLASVPLTDVAETAVLFEIVPQQSEVQFALDETLRGSDITVVGRTNQVAGQIAADFADLSTAQVGVIKVNARTLATDNEFRNTALRGHILQADDYEYITFTPTAVSGLPASINSGETATFTITGDLTIREVTQEVVFDAEVTAVSPTQLSGSASTAVNRADFNLTIPSAPGVANVGEVVQLHIDFVAVPSDNNE